MCKHRTIFTLSSSVVLSVLSVCVCLLSPHPFFFKSFYFVFLNSTGYGECLLDEPISRPYSLPQQLPGQIYNVNKQCELIFGPGTQVCPYMVSLSHHASAAGTNLKRIFFVVFYESKWINQQKLCMYVCLHVYFLASRVSARLRWCLLQMQCRRLWCTSPEGAQRGCRTQHMPWADGTDCSPGKVPFYFFWTAGFQQLRPPPVPLNPRPSSPQHCKHGLCITKENDATPVDGAWGVWSPFGTCSRTCGGGIKIAMRECNRPV